MGDFDCGKDLEKYVSNLEGDIYCIGGLPEEVIAVLLAYVSRSSRGVRENLKEVTEERAKDFHEKWVLGYGHRSVGELAVVHVGVERVSRLFSSLLERGNLYISVIEYSQRYQKPKLGGFHIPEELGGFLELRGEYIQYQNEQYRRYEKLLEIWGEHHGGRKEGKKEEKKEGKREFLKRSYEDARYVLPLGVYTSLGLTSNGRAMEDCLNILMASEYGELRRRGLEMRVEVQKQLPTLIKRVGEAGLLSRMGLRRGGLVEGMGIWGGGFKGEEGGKRVKLLNYTGKGNGGEGEALRLLILNLHYPYGRGSWGVLEGKVGGLSFEGKRRILDNFFGYYEGYDELPAGFESVGYEFELKISESCWHQLLRHRRLRLGWQYPGVGEGYVVPLGVKEYGGLGVFEEGMEASGRIYEKIRRVSHEASHYVVTNAHRKRVVVDISLKDLYYLVFLRTGKNVQWEVKGLVEELMEEVRGVHGYLMSKVKRKG